MTDRICVIGDIHGQLAAFVRLLRGAGLVDDRNRWSAGRTVLVLLGDFFDRGSNGIGAVELAMKLERQAARSGGRVLTLLGNHDLLLLAAKRFPRFHASHGPTLYQNWLDNGGVERDLERLKGSHRAWLEGLPALAKLGDTLFLHGDCAFYLDYGDSLEEVDEAFRQVLDGDDPAAFDRLLDGFGHHGGFEGEAGGRLAGRFLARFGATRLVHGHTPISKVAGLRPEQVTAARSYHQGRCLNADGGLYLGGPGFVLELAP